MDIFFEIGGHLRHVNDLTFLIDLGFCQAPRPSVQGNQAVHCEAMEGWDWSEMGAHLTVRGYRALKGFVVKAFQLQKPPVLWQDLQIYFFRKIISTPCKHATSWSGWRWQDEFQGAFVGWTSNWRWGWRPFLAALNVVHDHNTWCCHCVLCWNAPRIVRFLLWKIRFGLESQRDSSKKWSFAKSGGKDASLMTWCKMLLPGQVRKTGLLPGFHEMYRAGRPPAIQHAKQRQYSMSCGCCL